MLLGFFFLLFAYACFRGLTSDYRMYVFVLLIGFLQDPARKLMPGEPVQMTILVGVVVFAILVRQILMQHRSMVTPFTSWGSSLSAPLTMYLSIVMLQAIHSLVKFQSLLLTGLGAIFYIAPLIAIVVGYRIFSGFSSVRVFLLTYSVFATFVGLTILLSYSGVESSLLGEVGSGLIIYDQGTVLKAYSGLMRSSEISAWHLSASFCFIVIILMSTRFSIGVVFWVALSAVILLSAMILTGRRKSLVQLLLFLLFYIPLLQHYRKNLSNTLFSLFLVAILCLLAASVLTPQLQGTTYDLYIARGVSVFDDLGGRASQLGLGSVVWAYRLHGIFGGGLGVSSQGAQHFVEGYTGGAGEGGLGKIVSELSFFVLPILVWLGLKIIQHINRALKAISVMSPENLSVSVGVLAFLMANLPSFMVASQAFGDVFILLILGLLASSLFAIPKQLSLYLSSRSKMENTRYT